MTKEEYLALLPAVKYYNSFVVSLHKIVIGRFCALLSSENSLYPPAQFASEFYVTDVSGDETSLWFTIERYGYTSDDSQVAFTIDELLNPGSFIVETDRIYEEAVAKQQEKLQGKVDTIKESELKLLQELKDKYEV